MAICISFWFERRSDASLSSYLWIFSAFVTIFGSLFLFRLHYLSLVQLRIPWRFAGPNLFDFSYFGTSQSPPSLTWTRYFPSRCIIHVEHATPSLLLQRYYLRFLGNFSDQYRSTLYFPCLTLSHCSRFFAALSQIPLLSRPKEAQKRRAKFTRFAGKRRESSRGEAVALFYFSTWWSYSTLFTHCFYSLNYNLIM